MVKHIYLSINRYILYFFKNKIKYFFKLKRRFMTIFNTLYTKCTGKIKLHNPNHPIKNTS